MNFKSLKVVLISLVLGLSTQVFGETNTEKETRIEGDLNKVFEKALNISAFKLDKAWKMEPFAVIQKKNSEVAVFQLDPSQTKEMSVDNMTYAIRKYLTELAIADQIQASAVIMFAVVENQGEKAQGLSFEIEHVDGVSMLRFLPVTEKQEESGKKMVLHTESLSTNSKPVTVFTELAKSIAANKK